MATREKPSRLYTPRGIGCFVNLHTPRQRKDAKGQPKGDPKYGLLMYFDTKADLSELIEAAEAKALEKFGSKWEKLKDSGKLNWPIRDAEELEESGEPFNNGGFVINFKKEDKPGIVDADAEPLMEKSDVYSGMICRVSCRAFAYDNESKGVSFALINVQKLDDGTRMSGDPDAEDDFGKAPPASKGKTGKKVNVDDLL